MVASMRFLNLLDMKTRTTNAVRVLGALMLCAGLLLCGCYDDSALRDQLNDYGEQLSDHESRLKELETLCSQMNTNIEALQTIVSALQDKDYVAGVAPIKEGDEVLGYSITFGKSGTVTIYDGKDGQDGKDGYVPSLGVKQEGDQWYWTLDGEWLTDADGNKVRASAKDGKDGQDGKPGVDGVEGTAGVTPTLKIEGGYWYVSFDGGKTWESDSLGQATGDKGDSMFEAVTYDDAYVYITMSDGQQLTLPRTSTSQGGGDDEGAGEFSITFDDYDIGVAPGSSASVAYTITGATDKTTVKAMGQNGWRAEVIQDGTNKGKIKVTAPDPITDDEILVWAYDGDYRTIMSSINFVTGTITPSKSEYEVSADAGTLEISVSTNYNYSVQIPESVQPWLSLVATKSMRTDVITLAYSANTGSSRHAVIRFYDESGNELDSVTLVQEGVFVGVGLSASGVANCYIVSESGSYKFTPTKGNSTKSVGAIASASVLWESFGTSTAPNVGDLIKAVSYEDGAISFQTTDTFKEGNAVIAAKDASGTILWSWHIWLTDQPQGQVYYNNAGTMMDRNLGATSATPGDVGALGLLYQWGRKDPFLGSSSISNDIKAKSTINWPSAVSSDSSTGTIAYATAHPTTFITRNTNNYDWYYTGSSSTDNSRWTTSESNKSIYDPCPSGWRVPDGGDDGVWSKACGSSSNFGGYPYNSTNGGMDFSGKFGSASSIWYPASGYRSYYDGGLYNVGNNGSYWSASPDSYYAYGLDFYGDGDVDPSNDLSRAYGYSVRCLQESK